MIGDHEERLLGTISQRRRRSLPLASCCVGLTVSLLFFLVASAFLWRAAPGDRSSFALHQWSQAGAWQQCGAEVICQSAYSCCRRSSSYSHCVPDLLAPVMFCRPKEEEGGDSHDDPPRPSTREQDGQQQRDHDQDPPPVKVDRDPPPPRDPVHEPPPPRDHGGGEPRRNVEGGEDPRPRHHEEARPAHRHEGPRHDPPGDDEADQHDNGGHAPGGDEGRGDDGSTGASGDVRSSQASLRLLRCLLLTLGVVVLPLLAWRRWGLQQVVTDLDRLDRLLYPGAPGGQPVEGLRVVEGTPPAPPSCSPPLPYRPPLAPLPENPTAESSESCAKPCQREGGIARTAAGWAAETAAAARMAAARAAAATEAAAREGVARATAGWSASDATSAAAASTSPGSRGSPSAGAGPVEVEAPPSRPTGRTVEATDAPAPTRARSSSPARSRNGFFHIFGGLS